MQSFDDILIKVREQSAAATDLAALEQVRVHFLGKKGSVTELMKAMASLAPAERPAYGQKVNDLKVAIQSLLQDKQLQLQQSALNEALERDAVDTSLPGRGIGVGHLHPVTQTRLRIEAFFSGMGFDIVSGPEIEDEYHNFDALNIPAHHPARASHDTFYLENGLLLRTHTSPVQIRYMKTHKPPFRMVAPGRVYRCDSDMTHTPMFHQLEALLVDDHSTFADLKGLLHSFLEAFFEQSVVLRLRPSYFPFTEPSAEVDIQCVKCKGEGCRTCGQSGWLEILGCGMVHPQVLANVGIDSERYSGFAIGMGIDRLTMLRYEIPDLRLLFENDIRFLQQF
ncbi:MAG: phenylalanyl-tRNA synthetase subunit alpha [Gammaproteobacteria bacterium]|nr:phenylalanyl-tRNA synthetase subunit alpha [Gammaproteobacteria bacterium]